MLHLNDDCLINIFDKLKLRDQLRLTTVCDRFRDIIVSVLWRSRFRRVETNGNSDSDTLSHSEFISLLHLIGHTINHLIISERTDRWRPEPTAYLRLKFPVLRVLEIHIDADEVDMELLAAQCPLIEELHLNSKAWLHLKDIADMHNLRKLCAPNSFIRWPVELQKILTALPLTELCFKRVRMNYPRLISEVVLGTKDLQVLRMCFRWDMRDIMTCMVDLASTTERHDPLTVYINYEDDDMKDKYDKSYESDESDGNDNDGKVNVNYFLFQVAWMHFEQSAILTVHNHVITRNPRISVTHDKHDRHRTWYLHINNVHEEDKGRYMCQINTVTAKTQFGYLNVVVPPNIDDSLSSSDVIVREGSNISLRCRATGSPRPIIKWKRDDNSRITINKNHIVNEWEGDTLEITRISRLDMGAYLCIASNGVPPTVSKRIKVSVDFPPMLLIPHQLVGAPEGFNVTIECFTEAHPTSLNYWTRGEGPIIHDSLKYKVESSIGVPLYKTHMKLTISNVNSADDGIYKCVAKNPRGETDGIIRLYVSYPPTTPYTGLYTTESRWDSHYGHGGHDGSRSIYAQDKNKTHAATGLGLNGGAAGEAGAGGAYGLPAQGDELHGGALRHGGNTMLAMLSHLLGTYFGLRLLFASASICF